MSKDRFNHGILLYNGSVYVFAGNSTEQDVLRVNERFSVSENTWAGIQPFPIELDRIAVAEHRD
ncbi:MAG: hypothetical protein V2I33_20495 [Kangiellaceae bacterium]|nr:hypothetical protein [Kangiellaceae bacterium]